MQHEKRVEVFIIMVQECQEVVVQPPLFLERKWRRSRVTKDSDLVHSVQISSDKRYTIWKRYKYQGQPG